MSILTLPQRYAMILVDAHESIRSAYPYTVDNVDLVERPGWYITVEDEQIPGDTNEQEIVEQSYEFHYLGENFGAGYAEEYEAMARQVAVATRNYLLEHQFGQMSNTRGLFANPLPPLDGVLSVRPQSRSAITLGGRNAVGDAFWQFSFSMVERAQVAYTLKMISPSS